MKLSKIVRNPGIWLYAGEKTVWHVGADENRYAFAGFAPRAVS